MPERLIRARLNRGLSIRAAASEIGISPRTLERLERGEPIQPAKAKLIADFYGWRVTDIWQFENETAA